MRRASLAAAATVGALVSAVPLAPLAAQARPLALRTPDAEYAEPFTFVSGVRELRDGRVVVVDRGEKSIQLVDLAAGTATRLGREGGGPNEYRQPNAVFALPGDTTLVHDFGNQRYLTLGPDGQVLGTFTTADPGEGDLMRLLPARGVDGLGNMYFFDSGLRRGGDGPMRMESPDSGTVLRYDRATQRMTPIGKVAVPKTEVQSSGTASNQRVMVRMGTPFAAQDVWTVGLDGRLGIVRHDPFRVEWLAPNGQRVTGPTMPYEKIRVTDADKEELRQNASRQQGMGMSMTVTRGPGGTSAQAAPAPMTTTMRAPEPTNFPEFKPPFPGGQSTAMVAPDGRLWVLRSNKAGDRVPRYDVFDSFGKLAGTVLLPASTRLVGFGRSSAYVVRTDEDDLQYLQRYKIF